MIRFFLISLWAFSFLASAAPRGGGGNFQSNLLNAKRSQKVASQWTLADWLDQKRKMGLADQWLALHRSATLFETNMSGGRSSYKLKTTDALGVETEGSRTSQTYQLDLYLSIFNFFGEYEKTSDPREEYGGGAGIRLFGTSSQTTSLLARYGWRKLLYLGTHETWENQFAEGQLQLYIMKNFGLNGGYRYFLPNRSNLGTKLSGSRLTAGAFLEFMIFRGFAEYFEEPLELTDNLGVKTKEDRRGWTGGVKLYF